MISKCAFRCLDFFSIMKMPAMESVDYFVFEDGSMATACKAKDHFVACVSMRFNWQGIISTSLATPSLIDIHRAECTAFTSVSLHYSWCHEPSFHLAIFTSLRPPVHLSTLLSTFSMITSRIRLPNVDNLRNIKEKEVKFVLLRLFWIDDKMTKAGKYSKLLLLLSEIPFLKCR